MAFTDESATDSATDEAGGALILDFPNQAPSVRSRLRSFGRSLLERVPTSPVSKASDGRQDHPSVPAAEPVQLHLYRSRQHDS